MQCRNPKLAVIHKLNLSLSFVDLSARQKLSNIYIKLSKLESSFLLHILILLAGGFYGVNKPNAFCDKIILNLFFLSKLVCPPGWKEFKGNCYGFVPKFMSLQKAKKFCVERKVLDIFTFVFFVCESSPVRKVLMLVRSFSG